eukprot:scaffold6288_cov139-Isochrysis_galbana.AAC.4
MRSRAVALRCCWCAECRSGEVAQTDRQGAKGARVRDRPVAGELPGWRVRGAGAEGGVEVWRVRVSDRPWAVGGWGSWRCLLRGHRSWLVAVAAVYMGTRLRTCTCVWATTDRRPTGRDRTNWHRSGSGPTSSMQHVSGTCYTHTLCATLHTATYCMYAHMCT